MKTKQEILEALNTGEAMSHKQISAKCKRYAPAVRIEINKLVSEGRLRVARYEKGKGAPTAYFDNKVHLQSALPYVSVCPRCAPKEAAIESAPGDNIFPAWMR